MSDRLDAENERLEQVRYQMKLEVLEDPVAMFAMIPDCYGKPENKRLWELVGILTNQGIELQGGKYHHDLPEQTLDVVKELAELVEKAVEEYLDNGE